MHENELSQLVELEQKAPKQKIKKKTLLMASRFKKLNPKLNVVCVTFHITPETTIIFYTQCVYLSKSNVDC